MYIQVNKGSKRRNCQGQKKMTDEKTAGKTARFSGVMLALTKEDAKEIKLLLNDQSYCNDELVAKISKRIEKSINRQEIIKALEEKGVEPTKENIKRAMEAGGSDEK